MKKLITLLALCSATGAFAQYSVGYRLVNPKGGVLKNTPYRMYFDKSIQVLRAPTTVKVIDGSIIHGVTDAQGDSAVVILSRRPDGTEWTLLQRFGDEPYGFTAVFQSKSGELSAFTDYKITMCDKRVYIGITDDMGQTPYFTHKTPCNAVIETSGLSTHKLPSENVK